MGWWRETGAPGGNSSRHVENMQKLYAERPLELNSGPSCCEARLLAKPSPCVRWQSLLCYEFFVYPRCPSVVLTLHVTEAYFQQCTSDTRGGGSVNKAHSPSLQRAHTWPESGRHHHPWEPHLCTHWWDRLTVGGRAEAVTGCYHNFILPLPAQPLTVRPKQTPRQTTYTRETLEPLPSFSLWLVVRAGDTFCQVGWQKCTY